MITLKTGLPRNGKSISVVAELLALIERWKKHPEETRPVYQYGITDLKLPAITIEAWPAHGQKGDPIPLTPNGKPACPLAFDEHSIPDGALILIDEAQDFYPPRGPSQKPPQHVAVLNTHGHRNLDYVLMTQHPKLIDNTVRRLVNKHQHYRRTFGGGSAITYEWDVCSDTLEYHKAVKGLFRYPKKVFGLYKSASGFTKPTFKLPAFLAVPALAVPLAIWALPNAFDKLGGAMTGQGISDAAKPAAAASSASRPASRPAVAAPQKPESSEAQAQRAPKKPAIAGCMTMGHVCRCVDSDGNTAKVEEAECKVASVELGGLIPYDTAPRPAITKPAPATEPSKPPEVLGFNAGDFRERPARQRP